MAETGASGNEKERNERATSPERVRGRRRETDVAGATPGDGIMQRRIDIGQRESLWLERLAWNAAAGAAVAVMILVLLGSLRLLDAVEDQVGADPRPAAVSTRGSDATN